jgi:hypothetical protein
MLTRRGEVAAATLVILGVLGLIQIVEVVLSPLGG